MAMCQLSSALASAYVQSSAFRKTSVTPRVAKTEYSQNTLKRMAFCDVAPLWLAANRIHLKPRTAKGYEQHLKQLNLFFGPQRLESIHIGHVRMFQRARTENADGLWPKTATAEYVNHQCVVLKGVMDYAGEWEKIGLRGYQPLKLPAFRPPKVMSDEEELRFFAIGESSPDFLMAFLAASITINTGASGTELRHLRFGDVHLDAPKPWIRIDADTAKNEFRGRIVQLNRTAQGILQRCMDRGRELGGGRPEHFIFPFRVNPGVWDPTRATTEGWLRRSFNDLCTAADVPWLTPHCLRHQHITISMEAGEPIEQIMLRVGHISPEMTRWYTSSRSDSQERGVNAIDPSVRFAAIRAAVAAAMASNA